MNPQVEQGYHVPPDEAGQGDHGEPQEVNTDLHQLPHERSPAETDLAPFFGLSLGLLCIADTNGFFRALSPAWEDLLGYTVEELKALPFADLVHPDDREATLREVNQLAQGLPTVHFDNRYLCKDGGYRCLAWKAQAIGARIYAVAQDVTDQKNTEAALKERESHFRLLFEDNPLPMWVYDLETLSVLEVNEAALAKYGYSRNEFVGLRITDLRPPADVPALMHDLEQGRPSLQRSGPWRHQLKDGTLIDVEIDSHTLDSGGRAAVLVVAHDITERRRADAERAHLLEMEREARDAATRSQERVDFLLRTMLTLQAQGLDYTGSLRRLADSIVPELADWCVIDIARDDDQIERVAVVHRNPEKIELARELERRYPPKPDVETGIRAVLRSGERVFYPAIPDELLTQVARDSEHLRLLRALGLGSSVIMPLAAHGRTIGAITLVMAESERQFTPDDLALVEDLARRAAIVVDNARLYEDLRRSNETLEARVQDRTAQLEDANQELESFSYSVSHDLRSPLRAIEGFSRILVENHSEALPEQAQAYLQRVRQNALRMGTLIDDLLQFSRIGRKPLQKRTVHPKQLAEEVLEELAPLHEGRDVDIIVQDLPPCSADPALLKQVYANLIGNAIKFTQYRAPARIEVGAQRDGEDVHYYVADNGAGFDMRYTAKLFGVFQRLHRAEDYEGTGVGLAIVHRIVQRHGGRIWAEAAPDKGATFYFTLAPFDEA